MQESWSKVKNTFNSFVEFLLSSKRLILLIALTVLVILTISSMVSLWLNEVDLRVPSLGTIKTLGVEAYWDSDLKNQTERIDWGTIWPGMSKNITLHVRSKSNIETALELRAANWTFRDSNDSIVTGPSISSPYMNLTWNYDETIVGPSEVIRVTLTLSVDISSDFIEFLVTNDVEKFSVDIIIYTAEHSD